MPRVPGEFVPFDVNSQRDLSCVSPYAELLFYRTNAAVRLHKAAGSVREYDLIVTGAGLRNVMKLVAELVEHGFWIVDGDGWYIRSWEKWNGTSAQANDEKEAQRAAAIKTNHDRWHEGTGKFDPKCVHCQASPDRLASDNGTESQKKKEKEKEKKITTTDVAEATSETSDFDAFWAAYPKRDGKAAARKAWTKAIKRTDLDTIITAVEAFAALKARQRTETRFIPNASTWLNQERWNDETPYEPTTRDDEPVDRSPNITELRLAGLLDDEPRPAVRGYYAALTAGRPRPTAPTSLPAEPEAGSR